MRLGLVALNRHSSLEGVELLHGGAVEDPMVMIC